MEPRISIITLGVADLPRAEELTIALQPHRPELPLDDAGALASVEEG